MSKINVNELTAEQKAALLAELQADASNNRIQRREAYEGLRSQFIHEVQHNVILLVADVKGFHSWIEKETKAFSETMKEYGQVKNSDQMNFTITDGNFKMEVKASKVKAFDERADLAAERLIDYLKRYMQQSEKGADDPMYQMAMTLLERNKMGDLDYKSISKLYELEDKFDQEYADIMTLFKESNQVQKTAINYYFHERGEDGIWRRIEPSFCRM
ncbi:MAG: DUF3164 family protein [Prevotella sp.]|nr:DUF3164 family protein [Prevotella sp.]